MGLHVEIANGYLITGTLRTIRFCFNSVVPPCVVPRYGEEPVNCVSLFDLCETGLGRNRLKIYHSY